MANAFNWVEIPSVDFDRAVAFYGTILDTPLRTELFGGTPNGMFVTDGGEEVGGAVVKNDSKPSTEGSLAYLNAGDQERLEQILGRVESAGGSVVLPKTSIGDPGWIAVFLDTEGNRVGLHCPV